MIYVALIRGINVGGKNRIKMDELKRMCEDMGLHSVRTYIQSGNILFESEENEDILRIRLEHGIEETFGFSVAVILRTSEELKRIAANCPFSQLEVSEAEASSEGESLYVSFMLEKPSQQAVERLQAYKSEFDKYLIDGREIFLLFYQSIRNSKLANNLQKLDVPATVRNWKTLNKLVELAGTMEIE